MKVTVTGKGINVWESTKQILEKKLSRLDRFFTDDAVAEYHASVRGILLRESMFD